MDTKVTLSSIFHLAAAVAESPPPMIPILPAAVVSATASSNALVPLEKLSNSKTPEDARFAVYEEEERQHDFC